jgi:hypothetical protein
VIVRQADTDALNVQFAGARARPAPLSVTVGRPSSSVSVSMSWNATLCVLLPGPRIPTPSNLATASFAAQRAASELIRPAHSAISAGE